MRNIKTDFSINEAMKLLNSVSEDIQWAMVVKERDANKAVVMGSNHKNDTQESLANLLGDSACNIMDRVQDKTQTRH